MKNIAIALASVAMTASAIAQITTRVSVDSQGAEGKHYSGFSSPAVTGDGHLVVFASFAANLVLADTNRRWDVFLHDRRTSETTRVSVDSSGVEGNGDSGGIWGPLFNGVDISADGGCVAFVSKASNLVPGDSNEATDIFVHDLQTGQTTRVSLSSLGSQANGDSYNVAISRGGDRVAFQSHASNLVPSDTNGTADVFLHDRATEQTIRVSVDSDGAQANGLSRQVAISGDGLLVGFDSYATNLVLDDSNGTLDAFVHDVRSGQTKRVSVTARGEEGFGESAMGDFSLDGRFVGFSSSSVLVPDDTNGVWDDHVRDLFTDELARVSVDSDGVQGNDSCYGLALSADGRYVAFSGYASNLVPGDVNGNQDVFLHDRLTGETSIASVSSEGEHGNNESCYPALSSDGGSVVYNSHSTNLVALDGNAAQDVFVHAPFVLRMNGSPSRASLVSFTASHANPEQTGSLAVVLLSCSGTSAVPLSREKTLYLTFDACTSAGLGFLSLLSAVVDATGKATTPTFLFPVIPSGITFYAAAVVVDLDAKEAGSVADPIAIRTQ